MKERMLPPDLKDYKRKPTVLEVLIKLFAAILLTILLGAEYLQ